MLNPNRFPAPVNFAWPSVTGAEVGDQRLVLRTARGEIEYGFAREGTARIRARQGETGRDNPSMAPLAVDGSVKVRVERNGDRVVLSSGDVELDVDIRDASFELRRSGRFAARSTPAPFGVSGTRQMMMLERPEQTVAYGLGEKTRGLDKSNRSYYFWNVDVVADHPHSFMKDDFDPSYVSIPFLITKHTTDFYGVLLNNPHRTFVHAGLRIEPDMLFHTSLGVRSIGDSVVAFGAQQGELDLFLFAGPALRDVVRGHARLTGTHELPPLWALGYHQCRWSYDSAADLARVADELAAARIPVGAMWMDIDYMDGFRVFTWHRENFSPAARNDSFARIKARGTRLVTIVDPGIKAEPGYDVYDEFASKDLLCKTPEGAAYIGIVWPGRTVFPDFSLEEARAAWSTRIASQLGTGIDGIWIDMNDPSTGPIDYDDMLFQRGAAPHSAYHNQYADQMARATLAGFEERDATLRPFILTRSGYNGIQNYAAVWTGDNASNEQHLVMSIPQSVNLALSGVSFNGPDVGGFVFDTTEELMVAWNLAGALFPFYRNHSCKGTRAQEPSAFSAAALDIIRRCVQTRAKLLPYLYAQFFLHMRDGDAILRPLSYEFPGAEFERIGDQFLLGPSLMMAPFLDTASKERAVVLPPGWWFDLGVGEWIAGGRTITVVRRDSMIVYVRDGSVIPALEGTDFFPQPDITRVGFHVFARERDAGGIWYEDDGETHGYRAGAYNLCDLRTRLERGRFSLAVDHLHRSGARPAVRRRCYYYGLAPNEATADTAEWPFGSISVRGTSMMA